MPRFTKRNWFVLAGIASCDRKAAQPILFRHIEIKANVSCQCREDSQVMSPGEFYLAHDGQRFEILLRALLSMETNHIVWAIAAQLQGMNSRREVILGLFNPLPHQPGYWISRRNRAPCLPARPDAQSFRCSFCAKRIPRAAIRQSRPQEPDPQPPGALPPAFAA